MNTQPIKNLTFTPSSSIKALLIEITTKYQGQEQDRAALMITHNQAYKMMPAVGNTKWEHTRPINMALNNIRPNMITDSTVFIVDDDYAVRDGLELVIGTSGIACQTFKSAEDFLLDYSPDMSGCLLLDITMPGMSGLELQNELIRRNSHLPIIFLSAHSETLMKMRAINAGAADFLTKPVSSKLLIERIRAVL